MQVKIYGKDVELTPEVKSYAENKIGGLDRFLKNILEVHVDLIKTTQHHKQGDIYKASANIHIPGSKIYADFSAETVLASIDGLVDQLQGEIKKTKGKKGTKQMKGLRKLKNLMTSFLSRKKDSVEDEDTYEG